MTQITLALTKGRILKETLPLLDQAGIEPLEDIFSSRKLVFETNRAELRLLILEGSDVATYVQFGAADIGVAGKDFATRAPRRWILRAPRSWYCTLQAYDCCS
jgi:ATP phosphoribosyltransferase